MEPRKTYEVHIAGVTRHLQLFQVAPNLKIAILNILGDTELVEAAAKELKRRVQDLDLTPEVIVTAEAKSIPLAYALALKMGIPYVVLRKSYKSYMGTVIMTETVSITTGQTQKLYLDEKDHELLRGKNVLVVDDVISTGSTLHGMAAIVNQAGGVVIAEAAILTEGDNPAEWEHIIALGHLPLFRS